MSSEPFTKDGQAFMDHLYQESIQAKTNHDPVKYPSHYNQGDIECIDAIRAALTPEEWRGWLKGNALKYIWRERFKGQTQDVHKARENLRRLEEFDGSQTSKS
jgi:hypothetical protein